MIISHKHKFIFLKTHKTAGTSLQIALSKHCGERDIISRIHETDKEELIKAGGKGRQNDMVPYSSYRMKDWFQYLARGRKQYFSEHLSMTETKAWIGSDIWDSYFTFCIERNPIEKVLSYYYWRTRSLQSSMDQFLDEYIHTLSDFHMYANAKAVQVDRVFLYEELDECISFLEQKFDFSLDLKNIKAKASYRPRAEEDKYQFTPDQIKMIKNAFSREINSFYPELHTI